MRWLRKEEKPWVMEMNIVIACLRYIDMEWEVHIRHNYREGNHAVDFLATLVFSHDRGLVIYQRTLHHRLSTVLDDDRLGAVWPRSRGGQGLCSGSSIPESLPIFYFIFI